MDFEIEKLRQTNTQLKEHFLLCCRFMMINFQEQVTELTAERGVLDKNKSKMDKMVAQLQQQVKTLKSEWDILQGQNSQLQIQLSGVITEHNDIQERKGLVDSELVKVTQENIILQEQISNLKHEITILQEHKKPDVCRFGTTPPEEETTRVCYY